MLVGYYDLSFGGMWKNGLVKEATNISPLQIISLFSFSMNIDFIIHLDICYV
jgi:hypothetical protein